MNIQKLQQENSDLKHKLKIAQKWMEKEVRSQVKQIGVQHSQNGGKYNEISEEIITNKIMNFFGDILMLNVPGDFMENIISAEILFHSLEEHNNFDGLSIITSYHKALDVLIENFIIKGFRKYAHKQKQTTLRKNDVLEKTLHSVVNQGYILGMGRIYHLLKIIHDGEELGEYSLCFKEYLEKYNFLGDIILKKDFYIILGKLINSEILGKKRHVGTISLDETIKARKLLIGDFEDRNCIIYKLIETQKIEY